MAAGNLHVVPAEGNGWAVEVEGPDRFSIRYDSQDEAIRAASETARQSNVEMFVHAADGPGKTAR